MGGWRPLAQALRVWPNPGGSGLHFPRERLRQLSAARLAAAHARCPLLPPAADRRDHQTASCRCSGRRTVTSPPPVNKPSPPAPAPPPKRVTDLTGDKPAPLMQRKPQPRLGADTAALLDRIADLTGAKIGTSCELRREQQPGNLCPGRAIYACCRSCQNVSGHSIVLRRPLARRRHKWHLESLRLIMLDAPVVSLTNSYDALRAE
jgi:hypothetical protein